MPQCVPIRQRHEPEKTVLYRVLQAHLATFLAQVAADETRGSLPRFVVREFRDYLTCGIPKPWLLSGALRLMRVEPSRHVLRSA